VGRNVQTLAGSHQSLSVGSGGVQLVDQPPHPNAAKVFVNWLLTQRTQAQLAQITELNSRRRDVPPGKPDEVVDPAQLDKYVPHANEHWLPYRRRVLEIVNELLH